MFQIRRNCFRVGLSKFILKRPGRAQTLNWELHVAGIIFFVRDLHFLGSQFVQREPLEPYLKVQQFAENISYNSGSQLILSDYLVVVPQVCTTSF